MNAALGQTLMNLQFYSTSQTSKPTEQQQQQYQQNPSITYQQAAQMKGIGNANQQQQQQQQQQEMALNLSRSLQQQQPVNIVNMTSNKLLQPQQIQLQQHQIQQIQLQHQQQQPQLLETLMHAVPNATSTPNPIQQQQQDIFTNLLLKFDPTQFFVPKKDQLSFIFNNSGQTGAATTTASVSQNPTVIQFVQPVKQAQQPHQQFIQQQLQPQQPQHFQIIQQQPHQQQMQIQMQHQQQQHQIYLQHQQQQQQIYQQQQQQQQQFNGMANQSRLGQLVSASAVSTGSGGNVKQTPQQPPQSQNDDSSNDSDEEGNSTLGGNPHEKPYKCSQCFKLFRKKVHLNQHMRIHSGERPYACDFCEKRFTQLSHLWQHTRRHTGDKPYKCDVGSCDKAFSQLSNLQSHIRTHGSGAVSAHLTTVTNPTTTAAAPQSPVSTAISDAIAAVSGSQTTTTSSNNKCTKCWKQFSSKDELAAHMSTRHAGKAARNQLKRHFCEICHKRFATEGVIRTHVCSKLPNAVLVRNSEGSLVMRSNSALPQLINK